MSKSHGLYPQDIYEQIARILPEAALERHETHLSLVLLTEHYAYKLKKPVKYDFVDHSTFAKRWATGCHEINLNRRLSRSVYLGIIQLRASHCGEFAPLSWLETSAQKPPAHSEQDQVLVVMRRLSNADMLKSLVLQEASELPELVCSLAPILSFFHKSHKAPALSADSYLNTLRLYIEQNLKSLADELNKLELGQLYLNLLAYSSEFSKKSFNTNNQLMKNRLLKGYVVDGHGDLHLEHIFFEHAGAKRQLQIIDCLEFNADLRLGDAAADLGFLLMDLEFHKRADLAGTLLTQYIRSSSDNGISELLPFFKNYRALVRAKIHCLRAEQLPGQSAEFDQEKNIATRYLSLAASCCLRLQRPVLVLVCGLMGTGKSSLAKPLAQYLYAQYTNSDIVRKELFPEQSTHPQNSRQAAFEKGIYTQDATEQTYNDLLNRARKQLNHGNSIVLDATFGNREQRHKAFALARENKADLIIVECKLPEQLILRRLQERLKDKSRISDARPELLEAQLAAWQGITASEANLYLTANTEIPALPLCRQIIAEFQGLQAARQIP